MAGFLRNRDGASQALQQATASRLKDVVEPAGTSGFDSDDLQANIGMGGSQGYTKVVGAVLGGSDALSGLGTPDAADFQRADNHTRSPMSQTYFKRSAV